jgi:ubiquitin-conjugating enzyme E2 C
MSPVEGVSAFPDGDNFLMWNASITGPSDTVYENLVFKLSASFPQNYPFSPPEVKFITPCFHPNVDLPSGVICLDILKDKVWFRYLIRSGLRSTMSNLY